MNLRQRELHSSKLINLQNYEILHLMLQADRMTRI